MIFANNLTDDIINIINSKTYDAIADKILVPSRLPFQKDSNVRIRILIATKLDFTRFLIALKLHSYEH